MTEQLVKFETAKILKEKGFNEYSFYYYIVGFNSIKEDKIVKKFSNYEENDKLFQSIRLGKNQPHLALAPNQSLVQKWFREVHGIYIMITQQFYKDRVCHLFQVCKYQAWSELFGDNGEFTSYEDCLEEGILYALNLI